MRSKFLSFHPLTLRGRPKRIPPNLGVRRLASSFFPSRKFFRRAALKKPSEIIIKCGESNSLVTLEACWKCEKYRVWHEKDKGMRRCYYDYELLASTGFYDDPPEPDESAEREMEELIKRNEQIAEEMESERRELEALAQSLAKRMPSYLLDDIERNSEKACGEDSEEDGIDEDEGEESEEEILDQSYEESNE